jgi:hypothetical protein
MMRRFATIALSLASLASPLAAQSHPDFSGKWVLDTKASEGPMMPLAMTVVVTQDAKTLKVDNTSTMAMGEQKMEQKASLSYNLDGSPSKNVASGMGSSLDLMSTTSWSGPTLVITTKADLGGGNTMSQTDHWMLGADGKTLKLTRDVTVGAQAMAIKMSFVKQ